MTTVPFGELDSATVACHPQGLLATVVIPAFNAAGTIAVQLGALVEQDRAPSFEVVVADNGSTDGTREIVSAFGDRLNLRMIDASERRGPAYARNAGVKAARSAYILFCDADDRVSPGWVASLISRLEHESLVTGPVVYVSSIGARLETPGFRSKVYQGPRKYLEQTPYGPSCNLGIRRDLFEQLDGFDADLRTGEDADLTIRGQMIGAALCWEPSALVWYARRENLLGAIRQFFTYGYYNAAVYRKLRGRGLYPRPGYQLIRSYVVLLLTSYRLITRRRRSWMTAAAQRMGRLAGSVRFRVWCP